MVEQLGYKWFIGKKEPEFVTARDYLYWVIRDALLAGVFDRLRICPQCKDFFVADDARQQFCSNEHRNEFNNQQRLKAGYFINRRKTERKRALSRARSLLRQGKLPNEIAKATKLSLRVLKRERIIN